MNHLVSTMALLVIIMAACFPCAGAPSNPPNQEAPSESGDGSGKRAAAFDALLKRYGLEGLDKEEKKGVANLLSSLDVVGPLEESAVKYVKGQGYKQVTLSIATSKRDSWLIAQDVFGTYGTKDIPFQLSVLTFKNGKYFCKPDVFGGIKEMIDVDGRVLTFLLADWKEIRD